MIWLIMGIFVVGVLLYAAWPLYSKTAPRDEGDSEVKAYLGQIADIDARLKSTDKQDDISALELAKLDLQRQVLVKSENAKDAGPQAILISVLFITFAFGAMGLYATLGRPELTKAGALQKPILSPAQAMTQNANPKHENNMSLEQAVTSLEAKLKQNDNNPQGWMLYARSLMTLERFDEAITAYEKVLSLTDNHPNVLKEYESAKAFIAQRQGGAAPSQPRGPSAEQMRDAAAMTPEERQEMIQGMVANLSAKLQDNPNDPDGWVRLLRARKVMGAQTEAASELALMRETFKDDPETIERILSAAGW